MSRRNGRIWDAITGWRHARGHYTELELQAIREADQDEWLDMEREVEERLQGLRDGPVDWTPDPQCRKADKFNPPVEAAHRKRPLLKYIESLSDDAPREAKPHAHAAIYEGLRQPAADPARAATPQHVPEPEI